MAADKNHHDVPAMDYAEHEKTYALFGGMMKWGTVLSLGITLLAGAATNTISWLFAIIVTVLLTVGAAKF